jgi:hypothetical protein
MFRKGTSALNIEPAEDHVVSTPHDLSDESGFTGSPFKCSNNMATFPFQDLHSCSGCGPRERARSKYTADPRSESSKCPFERPADEIS